MTLGAQISHQDQVSCPLLALLPSVMPYRGPSSHSLYSKSLGKNAPIPDSRRAGSKVLSTGPCHRGSLGSPLKHHRVGSRTEFASSWTSAPSVGTVVSWGRVSYLKDGESMQGRRKHQFPLSSFLWTWVNSSLALSVSDLARDPSSCRMVRTGVGKVQLPTSPSPQITGDKPCGEAKRGWPRLRTNLGY